MDAFYFIQKYEKFHAFKFMNKSLSIEIYG